MRKNVICLCCPRSCHVVVDTTKKNVIGNCCKRGEEFALSEVDRPKRVLTSTVKVTNGVYDVASVKTKAAIDRDLIEKCMDKIRNCSIVAPVHIGDIVIKNILNTGTDLVATMNVEQKSCTLQY